MSLTITPDVEVYAADGWRDITDYVQNPNGTQRVEIEHANRGIIGGIPEPSECHMVWDVTDGLLWPGNPESAYFPDIDQNAPIRAALRLLDYDFASTVVNGIGPVTGTLGSLTATNTGAGGSVLASDFQQAGGVATHSVPTTTAHRKTVLATFNLRDCEQAIDFQLPVSDVLGGAIEPANLIFRWTADEHLLLRVTVETTEAITLHYRRILTAGSEFALTDTVTSTITNSGQWLRVKGNVEADRMQAKIWVRSDPEPLAWDIDESIGGGSSVISAQYKGAIGWRTGVASGNTNTKPIVVSYDNYMVRSVRFYGGLSEFDLDVVDETANVVLLPVVAAGSSRRMMQGETPVQSALRRSIPATDGVVWYCAMEDPVGSTQFAAGLPGQPAMVPLSGTPGYADYDGVAGSDALPKGNSSDWSGEVPAYTNTGVVQFRFIMRLVTAGISDLSILARWYTDHPSAKFWQLVYRTGGDLQLQWWNSESAFVGQSSVMDFNLDDDQAHRISIELTNSGSDVAYVVRQVNINNFAGGTSSSGTATGVQVQSVKRVWFNLQLRDTPVFGHAYLQDQVTSEFELLDPLLAYDGDEITERLDRLLTENGFNFTAITGGSTNLTMGPQRVGNLLDLVKQPVDVDIAGAWSDGRTHDGVVYRTRPATYGQDPIVTLSYSGHQLMKPWKPIRNDRDIRNKVTVKREGGSEATYEQTTGPRSTLPPGEGGVGVYPGGGVTVNPEDDSQLLQMAAFRVALGTVDEPRFPAARVELAIPPVLADPTIGLALLDARAGDLFQVTGATEVKQFDPVRQRIVGYRERFNQFMHEFELIGEPASPFDAFLAGDSDYGRLDSLGTTLAAALDSTATTFEIDAPSDVWTTNGSMFPFDIMVGGERMTCTAITAKVPAYIAKGTASHADNASCTPGIPGGATSASSDLCMITQGRGSRAATQPAGWSTVITSGGIRIFRALGNASAPTVSWSTGAAGDTNSAVITSWTNLGTFITYAESTSGGVQNIPVPELTNTAIVDGVTLTVGVKSDDWTSVATRTGMTGVTITEIIDEPTTVGSDQGIVADYVTHNGSSTGLPTIHRPFGEFVVTGGTTSGVRALVMLFGNKQTMTVTRSVNGVVKEHAAGTPVHIYRPSRWPL